MVRIRELLTADPVTQQKMLAEMEREMVAALSAKAAAMLKEAGDLQDRANDRTARLEEFTRMKMDLPPRALRLSEIERKRARNLVEKAAATLNEAVILQERANRRLEKLDNKKV